MRRCVWIPTEFVLLLLGSIAAGVIIGTLQHFVAFGVWAHDFNSPGLFLAWLEGGFVGAALAVPTGIVAYYLVLKRQANLRRVAMIVGGSLVGGCLLGAALCWQSAFVTLS